MFDKYKDQLINCKNEYYNEIFVQFLFRWFPLVWSIFVEFSKFPLAKSRYQLKSLSNQP